MREELLNKKETEFDRSENSQSIWMSKMLKLKDSLVEMCGLQKKLQV